MTSPPSAPPPPALLLGRPERSGDVHQAAAWVAGRRVLVTGAAGSVGTPLAAALRQANPALLALLDHHEHSLFSLERTLAPASGGLTYDLVDIRDALRLERAFERARPDVVFHLAAAKHVPYGERFPDAAAESNVLATDTLLRLADRFSVEVLVYPSSDKSVAPPSLYGATKRVCEALVQDWAADGRRWVLVRYVNILGTRGSVVETFATQVQNGTPLGVTDDRMTRYWISMDEALWLLLGAGHAAAAGQVLMPDCGEPVPVVETARRLAAWYAPNRDPYPINLTGIRPGERLHEVLLSENESFADGPLPGLRLVCSTRDPRAVARVPAVVDHLRKLVARGETERIRADLMAAAVALQ